MNRKWFALVLSAVLLLSLAAACGKKDDAGTAQNNNMGNEMNAPTNNTDIQLEFAVRDPLFPDTPCRSAGRPPSG